MLTVNGPAVAALDAAVARASALLRVLAVMFGLLFILIWHSWYAAAPWRAVAPLVSLGWGAAFAAVCLRRGPFPWLVGVDVGQGLLLAVGGGQLVPPPSVGDAGNWVFVAVSSVALAAAWSLPTLPGALAVLTLGAAYVVGAAITGVSGPAPGAPGRSFVLLVALSAIWGVAVQVLRRRGRAAVELLARIGAEQREAAVAEARARDRREQERIVHDTVLNTLTGIGWGGAGDEVDAVRLRSRRDLGVLESLLAARPDGPDRAASLLHRVGNVVDEARRDGLDIHLRAEPAGATDPGVPPDVAAAIAAAVREALANVRQHARTARAQVIVCLDGGGVRVVVADAGVGFDPARVEPGRLGVRRSIVDRLDEAGGSAEVRSIPGQGTTVVLSWG